MSQISRATGRTRFQSGQLEGSLGNLRAAEGRRQTPAAGRREPSLEEFSGAAASSEPLVRLLQGPDHSAMYEPLSATRKKRTDIARQRLLASACSDFSFKNIKDSIRSVSLNLILSPS